MQALGTIDRHDQLAALSDEHRLAILRRLMCGPSTISRLGREFDKHPAWVRHHVKRLEAVGLVESAGERTTRNYTEKFYRASAGAFSVHMLVAPSTGGKSPIMVLGSDDFALQMLASDLNEGPGGTMRVYVCFDDTDTLDCGRGTGKLGRWLMDRLPDGCVGWGVVRQQLLVHPDIPMTSHNSSACAVIDAPDASVVPALIETAIALIGENFFEGSDPGLCVATEADAAVLTRLGVFGRLAAVEVTDKAAARAAADGVHLSEHGGTGGGIIGAAAGVGLTALGWAGRLIDYRVPLRDFGRHVSVADIETAGIHVLAIDRNVGVPRPGDVVDTHDWLRPRLWGGEPAVPVMWAGEGAWDAVATRPGEER